MQIDRATGKFIGETLCYSKTMVCLRFGYHVNHLDTDLTARPCLGREGRVWGSCMIYLKNKVRVTHSFIHGRNNDNVGFFYDLQAVQVFFCIKRRQKGRG